MPAIWAKNNIVIPPILLLKPFMPTSTNGGSTGHAISNTLCSNDTLMPLLCALTRSKLLSLSSRIGTSSKQLHHAPHSLHQHQYTRMQTIVPPCVVGTPGPMSLALALMANLVSSSPVPAGRLPGCFLLPSESVLVKLLARGPSRVCQYRLPT